MCGIVGYVVTDAKVAPKDRATFLRNALILDTLRGFDSTGVMTVHKQFDVSFLKSTAPGHKFVELPEFKDFNSNGWAAVGHNRAATHGSTVVNNAHPFNYGAVHMVHNGTLVGKGYNLNKANMAVDSMHIALALSKVEPGEAAEVLERIDGTFALVWFDERDESINFARNKDRPLHLTWDKDQKLLTFMSDGHMLRSIMNTFPKYRNQGIASLQALRHIKLRKGSLVPEVAVFRPFSWARQTKQNYSPVQTSSGTSGVSPSLKDKWAEQRKRFQEKAEGRKPYKEGGTSESSVPTTTLGGFDRKVYVSGKRKNIPYSHRKYLEGIFTLSGGERFCFNMLDYKQLGKRKMLAFGEIIFSPWSAPDTPTYIDAIVTQTPHGYLPKAEVMAYGEQGWTVTPIGVSHPLTKSNGLPSLMCLVCNFDWKQEEKTRKDDELVSRLAAANEVYIDKDDDELIEFCGKLRVMKWIRGKLKHGCVQCGDPLFEEFLDEYLLVNGEKSIICEGCIQPWLAQ